jgi:hypothetical protein
MNNARMLVGCAMLAIAGQAAAVCTNQTRLTITGGANEIVDQLSGNTVCGTGLNANAGDRWQEWHQAGGTLTEYARGPSDPVDPTHDVGTWSTSGMGNTSVVTYSYNGGGTYSFSVHVDGAGTTFFCSGGTEVAEAILIPGQGACP